MNAAAIDTGTVKGKFTHGGKDYPLKHVYAWQPYAQTTELWIYLTDVEVPAAAAQDQWAYKPFVLARENRLRGVRLVINPAKPDPNKLTADSYVAGEVPMVTAAGGPKWQRLSVGDKRVIGKLEYKHNDRGKPWTLEAEFNAPVFGSSGKWQTLNGEQAQKSPQADAYLAYEKALLTQGLNAAGAYMTPELLADMHARGKKDAKFMESLAAARKGTLPGEARRRQMEKVVVDGDHAILHVRYTPEIVMKELLAKTKEGWKLAMY